MKNQNQVKVTIQHGHAFNYKGILEFKYSDIDSEFYLIKRDKE